MSEKYYVTTLDFYEKETTIEVPFEVWLLFEEERLQKERERNEQRNHRDNHSVEDYIVAVKIVSEPLEETYFRRETLHQIFKELESCTTTQRERFYLNRICGYSLTEIAAMQGCHLMSVKESVDSVLKKIKKVIF